MTKAERAERADLIARLVAGGLTKQQARLAVAKMDADGPDILMIDPKTGKATPAPLGPALID
jgi:hypothetical protein